VLVYKKRMGVKQKTILLLLIVSSIFNLVVLLLVVGFVGTDVATRSELVNSTIDRGDRLVLC
jgi:hypothetical protein